MILLSYRPQTTSGGITQNAALVCVAVSAVPCQAVLNGRPLVKNLSSPVTGVAVLNVNLQENPGNYTLILSVRGSLNLSEVWTKLDVQVVPCGPGQINVTGEFTHGCHHKAVRLSQHRGTIRHSSKPEASSRQPHEPTTTYTAWFGYAESF